MRRVAWESVAAREGVNDRMIQTHGNDLINLRHRPERATRLAFFVILSTIAALSFNAVPALGKNTHLFVSAWGGASSTPANPYPLGNPSAVAVDNSSGPSAGDIYVTDPVNHRIEKFDSGGNLILVFGSGVDRTTGGNVCTPASGDICQDGQSGHLPGQFEKPNFVAVDGSPGPSAGDVYIGDTGDNDVTKFDPGGNLVGAWGTGGQLDVSSPPTFSGVVLGGITVSSRGELLVVNSQSVLTFDQDGTPILSQGVVSDISAGGLAVDPSQDTFYTDESRRQVEEVGPSGGRVQYDFAPGSAEGLAADPGGGLYVSYSEHVGHYNSADVLLEEFGSAATIISGAGIAVDGHGTIYDANSGNGTVSVFRAAVVPDITTGEASEIGQRTATLHGHIELGGQGGKDITACQFEYVSDAAFQMTGYSEAATASCSPTPPFSEATDVSAEVSGLTPDVTYHYRLAASSPEGGNVGADRTVTPHAVIGISSDPATEITRESALLNGSFVGNGEHVEYRFEYGTADCSANPCTSIPISDVSAGSPSGPGRTTVSIELSNLTPLTTYHYRIVATDSVGTSVGNDQTVETLPLPPQVGPGSATAIGSDTATLHGPINTEEADTEYQFEYVEELLFRESGYATAHSFPTTPVDIGARDSAVSQQIGGLTPGDTYHYRLAATNAGGTTLGPDATFATFSISNPTDTCPNAHVRQQTSAALLPDCRAYELVSATNTNGYNVESDLVPGQTPFGGYPEASGAAEPSRVLYAIHYGGIPGVGEPTDYGDDPYVATRGKEGWDTEYVGIPASGTPSKLPFASSVLEADSSLDTIAFGGTNICSPCFADSSSGVPIRLSNGSLVQGMSGSENPGSEAKPDGFIGKHLSANGEHLIFGSASRFAPGGDSNGNVSIYDRNLASGNTYVVSKAPRGQEGNLACLQGEGDCHSPGDPAGISELDISSNGTHVLLGQLVSVDTKGNKYWHLYMNIGDSEHTIDLTPGTTHGVLYDGMTSDGAKVFFTTADPLATTSNQDTDASNDIYEAEVGESGATLGRISTGIDGTGNTDSCDPTENWNSISGGPNCNAVAIGGGGGVASGNGTFYFLSPELLDGPSDGVQNEPNLYVVRPGSPPHFVATLESTLTNPRPPAVQSHLYLRSFGTLDNPKGIAVNQSTNEIYVSDRNNERIERFAPSGGLLSIFGKEVNQTEDEEPGSTEAEKDLCTVASHDTCKVGTAGSQPGAFEDPAFIAVDNSTSPGDPSAGDVYVGDPADGIVTKFDANGNLIATWGREGQLDGSTAADGPFGGSLGGIAIGVGGELFAVNNRFGLFKFSQSGTFERDHGFGPSVAADGLAVDSAENLYFVTPGGSVDELNPEGGFVRSEPYPAAATGVAIAANDDLYVAYSDHVSEYGPGGNVVEEQSAAGHIENAEGLAVDGHDDLFVSNSEGGNVSEFTPPLPPESLAVFDSVHEPETRHTADFQVNPSGQAVFSTALSLKVDYDNGAHFELYRYDPVADELNCVSCNLTNAPAVGDSTLAGDGLSLTDDGRVFFNSTDTLAARDQDEKADVYEWEPEGDGTPRCMEGSGCISLISTGTSRFDSSLLGASADGTDAFFFTHDTLVPQDENGELAKIYDARELGGFLFIPKPVPCKASDECHGPGSQSAPPPNIATLEGSTGNAVTTKHRRKHRTHHANHVHHITHHRRKYARRHKAPKP